MIIFSFSSFLILINILILREYGRIFMKSLARITLEPFFFNYFVDFKFLEPEHVTWRLDFHNIYPCKMELKPRQFAWIERNSLLCSIDGTWLQYSDENNAGSSDWQRENTTYTSILSSLWVKEVKRILSSFVLMSRYRLSLTGLAS